MVKKTVQERDYCSKGFTVGENGLNSKYNKNKWGFTAKEQHGVSRWKITKRKHG